MSDRGDRRAAPRRCVPARASWPSGTCGSRPSAFPWLNNLSLRLADAGRRDEGLAAIEEAVRVYRRLATANPAGHEPEFAASLNNLSNHLANAGRRDEAERTQSEAVDVEERVRRRRGEGPSA